jgi:hypothetical protein
MINPWSRLTYKKHIGGSLSPHDSCRLMLDDPLCQQASGTAIMGWYANAPEPGEYETCVRRMPPVIVVTK